MIQAEKNKSINSYRTLSTSDFGQLETFNKDKGRQYTQLRPGELNAKCIEVNLGDVLLLREQLNIGTRIEASPPSSYVPFASLVIPSIRGSFYGNITPNKRLLQASGGDWDINISNHVDYVATIFSRDFLYQNYLLLTGQEFPIEWLKNKAVQTEETAFNQYTHGLSQLIYLLHQQPELLNHQLVKKAYSETVLDITLNALKPTSVYREKLLPQSKRIKGVRIAIEFLKDHAHLVPTKSELCEISGLSERSLQYGFQEYFGLTPNQYLRALRLNGVRQELIASSSDHHNVSNIALNWGFFELGRFSGEYKRFFNELPSATLKRCY